MDFVSRKHKKIGLAYWVVGLWGGQREVGMGKLVGVRCWRAWMPFFHLGTVRQYHFSFYQGYFKKKVGWFRWLVTQLLDKKNLCLVTHLTSKFKQWRRTQQTHRYSPRRDFRRLPVLILHASTPTYHMRPEISPKPSFAFPKFFLVQPFCSLHNSISIFLKWKIHLFSKFSARCYMLPLQSHKRPFIFVILSKFADTPNREVGPTPKILISISLTSFRMFRNSFNCSAETFPKRVLL